VGCHGQHHPSNDRMQLALVSGRLVHHIAASLPSCLPSHFSLYRRYMTFPSCLIWCLLFFFSRSTRLFGVATNRSVGKSNSVRAGIPTSCLLLCSTLLRPNIISQPIERRRQKWPPLDCFQLDDPVASHWIRNKDMTLLGFFSFFQY